MDPIASSAEAARFLALDGSLRDEADRVLDMSGLGDVLRVEGFKAVGSYVMRTMTWRDLDFEREEKAPSWSRHWELGAKLAKLAWVWKLHCTDAYRQPGSEDRGLYWGLRLSDPAGGPVWKVDLWTARAEEFARASPNRVRWGGLLTEEARVRILAIKKAVCGLPEYRREILAVHIYEAALDHGVRGLEEFDRWRKARFHSVGTTQA